MARDPKVRFIEAWPFSYELGDLDAKTSDVAVETISIAFEKMEFIKVPGGGGESSAESPAGPMTSPRALRGMGGV